MPTVRSNGVSLYYETRGRGKPLLLIGGLGLDITDLERMVAELAKGRKVIAFDNRGAGRSDKPDAPYTVEMMAEDAFGLLEALGVEKADVLGISMGGKIAMALALDHPASVRRLILASTSARVPKSKRRAVMFALMEVPRRIGGARSKYPQPGYAYRRQRVASQSYDAKSRLKDIRAPTLILHGRKDSIAPYRLAVEMATLIPNSKMETFDGGHLFVFWRQREFLSAVETFLGSRLPTAPRRA